LNPAEPNPPGGPARLDRRARGLARALLLLLTFAFALPAAAEEVDIELALLVDVSRSMSPAELELQRQGYAEALVSPEVLGAIGEGYLGKIAVTYVEWAGADSQRVVVDWTTIASAVDAARVAAQLSATFSGGLRRTSISGAIDFGTASILSNEYEGLRLVLDVSGDGPNNQGGAVTEARDRAIGMGLVINGLPIMTKDDDGFSRFRLDDLDLYYVDCVIGGPGGFVVPVTEWSQFADAVRRKLILEIAALPRLPMLHRAQASGNTPEGYDCLIGEKIWQRNQGFDLR
jgi:hypothetical protein